jgi:adenine-specific DNA-methyltransferase
MGKDWEIRQGDALEELRAMGADSVDLILTDPPYFKVKAEWWDRQWEKPEGFLSWIGELSEEWRRVLRPNGSLYCFASPQMAARVEVEIGKRFRVLNQIVWQKDRDRGKHAAANKESLRAYFPNTERIIFAEQHGSDGYARGESSYTAKVDELRGFVFEPLRAYLAGEWERAGLTAGDANAACGNQMAGHYFTRSQWALPTRENYEKLRERANQAQGEYLRREYEDLRREYEDLRRPFSVTADVPYTDVWGFSPVTHYKGKHPCEKPQDLLRHVVESSTRPGAVVLDCFAGSGATLEAAASLGRSAIGVEIDAGWCDQIRARMESRCAWSAGGAAVSTDPGTGVPRAELLF